MTKHEFAFAQRGVCHSYQGVIQRSEILFFVTSIECHLCGLDLSFGFRTDLMSETLLNAIFRSAGLDKTKHCLEGNEGEKYPTPEFLAVNPPLGYPEPIPFPQPPRELLEWMMEINKADCDECLIEKILGS